MQGLDKELALYNSSLPALLKDEGKYVVIYGDAIVGIYSAYDDALKAGYEKAGLKQFLVKKIAGAENISYFSRDLGPECHIQPQ